MRARRVARRRGVVLAAAVCLTALATGCTTRPAGPIDKTDLQSAESFPYFRLYWDGPIFDSQAVTGADGQAGYVPGLGSSIYYGNCAPGRGILHGGGCILPLQVTTVIYVAHSNESLGAQRNVLIRGVPATIFQGGRAIELYTGKLAVDVLANTPPRALRAAQLLRPVNAPGSAYAPLPPPDFCPGLWGPAPPYTVAREADGRLDCIDAAAQMGTAAAVPPGAAANGPPDQAGGG